LHLYSKVTVDYFIVKTLPQSAVTAYDAPPLAACDKR